LPPAAEGNLGGLIDEEIVIIFDIADAFSLPWDLYGL
jgi:hypothetical protein